MGEREIIKEYSNGELTVVWKPKICIHAGECVKRLPNVYNPDEKPWIKPENASTAELKEQIEACPSSALSYKLNNEPNNQEVDVSLDAIKVEVFKNGPLMVHGSLEVNYQDGEKEMKKRSTAFCRCGSSANKPYCDGAHNNINFDG